jgi:NitT/TauT family transport system ATP-binding protein
VTTAKTVTEIGSAARRTGAAVSVDGLVKRFGHGPVVLDRVSLTVAEGEFACLLGASGCGKSTLLSVLAGLDAPTSGSVAVTGGRAALMFQEPALLPWLTAGRNIELALRLGGGEYGGTSRAARAARRAEAQRLLALVRLDAAADKRPHELSGGMRQRVALARALAQQPRVLLMDEPFAALDAITRDLLHDELLRVWQETGVTVVFVTHNVREAVRLGERVLLMSSRPGRIVAEYPVELDAVQRIESPEIVELTLSITDRLREEIRRHAA